MMDYINIFRYFILNLYKNTKYLDAFNKNLAHTEPILQSTMKMIQYAGVRIEYIYEDDYTEVKFWVGESPDSIKRKIKDLIENEEKINDVDGFAVKIFYKVLDSILDKIRDSLTPAVYFDPKILIEDDDYDLLFKQTFNRDYMISRAFKDAIKQAKEEENV